MKKILVLLMLFTSMLTAQNISEFIEGKVLSKTSFWENKNIFTRNVIQTDNGNRVVITRGGVVGLNAEVVSDSPILIVGQKGRFKVIGDTLIDIELISNQSQKSLDVTNITPTSVAAGEGESVTITGVGFGAQNIVQFPNANYGGALHGNVLESQIVSWSDTEIVVEVPSFAGSGIAKVITLGGETFETAPIEVRFASNNLSYDIGEGDVEYPSRHINLNGDGGITWRYNVAFPEIARVDFEESLLTWACDTDMNWKTGEDTDIDVIANDGVNVVLFSQLGAGTLGFCTSRFQGCFEDGVIKWYISELDIVFNVNMLWSYGDTPVGGQINFKTVATHEIGHGRQLGHVIDNTKIMHYSLGSGIAKINLHPTDIEGGNRIQSRSIIAVCGNDPMVDFICDPLNVVDFETKDFKLYPNPATTKLVINGDFDELTLMDIRGTILLRTNTKEIKLNYQTGLYLLKIQKENNIITKKIIIL